MLPCPRPPNKSVLLEKFWVYVDSKHLILQGLDKERHIPDKRWLLDVLATFTPQEEIFKKSYQPSERASKLSEIRSIEMPVDFLKKFRCYLYCRICLKTGLNEFRAFCFGIPQLKSIWLMPLWLSLQIN